MVVLCHVNVRSLVAPGRLAELRDLAAMNDVDVLCITETWLKPKHLSSSLLLPDFHPPLRLDRHSSRGGGVAIYVRRGLAAEHSSLPASDVECTAWRIILPKRKRLVVVVTYPPPPPTHTHTWMLIPTWLHLRMLSHHVLPLISAFLVTLTPNTLPGSAIKSQMVLGWP